MAAELAVIVLGVLIALWADGWVAARADRQVEESRVSALRDNVVSSRARLADARAEARAAHAALTQIAYLEDAGEVGRSSEMVLSGLLFGPIFTPEMNVYNDLKSSGDLALLKNVPLRQALARMDAIFEQLALLQADLTTVQQLNFDPYVVRELVLGASLGPFMGLEDIPVDVSPGGGDVRILRNLAVFKLDMVIQLLEGYDSAADALDSVERAMLASR